MKQIALLGSTGSIGVTALRVMESAPDDYRVIALGAGRNIELLVRQIHRLRPRAVAVMDKEMAVLLESRLEDGCRPAVYHGTEGLTKLATMPEADTVISALAGSAGLLPTFEAVKAGKNLALANKETMVMAGPLVMEEAARKGVTILPIDSEHSAILQSLRGHPREDLRRVVLTASGGPFRDYSLEQMRRVTPAQALNHPTWEMGPKITIDSATLMNKGLEVIEAKWLFDLDTSQIDILI
ncbi:MAG: 1-deoxy-D-xylulose-5-phosphate reductoisomerase, partial [Desulfobacteraceae bacterium]